MDIMGFFYCQDRDFSRKIQRDLFRCGNSAKLVAFIRFTFMSE